MPTKASPFPICEHAGSGIRCGTIHDFKKLSPALSQRLRTSDDAWAVIASVFYEKICDREARALPGIIQRECGACTCARATAPAVRQESKRLSRPDEIARPV